jgi:thiamine biosynthesis lipoprotein ApbE
VQQWLTNSATDAGALATAFNVMKPSESVAMAESMKDVDYLIITRTVERFESKNWKKIRR